MRSLKLSKTAMILALLISGCTTKHTNTVSAPPAPPKPKFIGWDSFGHKKYDTATTAKIESAYGNIKPSKGVLLNEDAIICESEVALSSISEFVKDYISSDEIITGSRVVEIASIYADNLKRHERYKYEDELRYIQYDTEFTSKTKMEELAKITKREHEKEETERTISQDKKMVSKSNEILRICKPNESVMPVQVLEIKPISKIAKIKVNLNNASYELWTYENHLTKN